MIYTRLFYDDTTLNYKTCKKKNTLSYKTNEFIPGPLPHPPPSYCVFTKGTNLSVFGTTYFNNWNPEPIHVSVGLTVTDLSGNMCTHIGPPQRIFSDIARRPMSCKHLTLA